MARKVCKTYNMGVDKEGTYVDTMKEIKTEWVIALMILLEGLAIFFPKLMPPGMNELCLLTLVIVLILKRLQRIDHSLKRKYN